MIKFCINLYNYYTLSFMFGLETKLGQDMSCWKIKQFPNTAGIPVEKLVF